MDTFVKQLNLENKKSLETQWELAALYALNGSGIIEHETDFKRRPDVRWIARDLSCEFIADVRTVSDEGYEKDNPREFYREELWKQVKKFGGLDPSFFRDEPNHKMEGKSFKNRRVKLLYPPVNQYKRLFNRDFLNFLQRLKDNKPEHDSIRLTGEDFDVTIAYWVQKDGFRIGGGNVSYTTPFSPDRNPIYRALEKKNDQLKKAEYQGITPEKFIELNNLNSPQGNLFNLWLTQGLGINGATFEKKEDDDDYITLVYEPDFALKKYEVPKQGIRRFLFSLWQKIGFFPKKRVK